MTQPCPRQKYEAVMQVQKDHVSHWCDDRTCSYCGSMMPEDVFKAIDEGKKITPTDKNYKIYVDDTKKFYFQHFSKEDQDKFIEAHNAKRINFAYPGYFYVIPYFCKPVSDP